MGKREEEETKKRKKEVKQGLLKLEKEKKKLRKVGN